MDGTLSRERASGMLVAEVMIANPKTLPAGALVGDVRRVFEKKNVRTVLLAEGGRLPWRDRAGHGCRAAPGTTIAALPFADAEPLSTTPDTPMHEALALLDGRQEPRLVVLDEDGVTLRGLLCADSAGTGFCVR